MRKLFSEAEFKSAVEAGATVRELREKFQCAKCTISRWYRRYNVTPAADPHHRARIKTFNTRYFMNIDSEAKAYIVGFIAADGGRDRNWGVKIGLHPKDANILDKIAGEMSCSYAPELKENGTRIRLSLYDIDMVADLESYGIVERKTFCLPFAQNIPTALVMHYVRGIFDGDGSIGKDARLVTGSEPFYLGFLQWFRSRYGCEPWHVREDNKFRLVFRHTEQQFVRDMYEGATIYLDRKYHNYLKLRLRYDMVRASRVTARDRIPDSVVTQ